MAYKPPMIKTGSGPTGIAKVQIKEGKVRVEFKDTEVLDAPVILKQSECIETLKPGIWYVNLDANKTKVRSWRPVNGMFKAKVQKFAAQEDKPPVPQVHPTWGYSYFTVLFELLAPQEVKGCIVPNNYRYHFDSATVTNDKGEELEVLGFNHLKSKYTPQLVEFCDATGVWDSGPIKATDNALPIIQKRILKANKVVDVVLKEGFVVTIYGTDAEETE